MSRRSIFLQGLPWVRKLSIQRKLLGAFAINLVLMGALGFSALNELAFMQRKAAWVEDHTIASLRHVDQVEDAFARYRSLQLEFLIHTNEGDRRRLEGLLREVEATVAQTLATLEARLDAEDDQAQRQASSAVEARWLAYVEANWRRFLPSARLTGAGTVQPAFSRLQPLHDALVAATGRWVALNESQARSALGAVRGKYQGSRQTVLGATSAAVVLSALVGFGLAAHLALRIGRLSEATRQVAAGDLDTPVEPLGGDEIQTLAENFNTMVHKLREKRDALEERHRQLAASLEEQRRLMADLVRRTAEGEAADRARAAAEAASQAKSLFLATMSHELRTPLNAMMGYAQLLYLAAGARGDSLGRDDLERLLAAGRHLATVITNILDFSKIEQGKMDVEWLEVDLPALLREVAQLLEPSAAERGNTLRLELDPALGTLRSDPGKVRQILFNLLSNAVKFTERGAIVLAAAPLAEGGAELRVIDSGIGIAAEQLPRLFQAFEQADSTITRRFGGTGLGLVVSQQLTELLGGELGVESAPGRGSTFTVTLPAAPAAFPPPRPQAKAAAPPFQELA